MTKNVFSDISSHKALVQKAWNNINTAYLTIGVMSFPPNVVAAACVDLTISESKMKVDPQWQKTVGVMSV